MVPARSLRLLRDAHGAAGVGVTAAPPSTHMAQEPPDQDHHREPSKQAPPPPQEREADRESSRHGEAHAEQKHHLLPLQPASTVVVTEEAVGTSNGSRGNGGAGDWLRLGLAPASSSPSAAVAAAGSPLDLSAADRAGPPLVQPQPTPRMGAVLPAAPFVVQPALPGVPQPSMITMPGPPCMPPWSPGAAAFPSPPFVHRAFYSPGGAGASGVDAIRVVLSPAAVATAAGVWFALQAAPHQGREPFLPQIPRSFLRIKDVRVTVGLLIKYLVIKLGLEDESEVEITCRGRPLLPFLTLQHVRDSIWCQGDLVSPSVAPDISAANHVMVLQYRRRP